MVIPGIDGQKMSKSYGNYIDIFLPEKELQKINEEKFCLTPLRWKHRKIQIPTLLSSSIRSLPVNSDVETMRQNYLNGGYGYGHAKQALFEALKTRFAKEREIVYVLLPRKSRRT
jgi:tryptophanyl-tRNA synthetase